MQMLFYAVQICCSLTGLFGERAQSGVHKVVDTKSPTRQGLRTALVAVDCGGDSEHSLGTKMTDTYRR